MATDTADIAEADRAVPPPQRLRPRGSNQVGMRQFNERVVLQAIRLHGSVAKAEIARLTQLTAQTVQIIIARLEADGLVRKLEPVRGKVGQPSVPMALNPDGAFSIGIKVGRRSMDVLLVDFNGTVRQRWNRSYAMPEPQAVLAEIGQRLDDIRRGLGTEHHQRVQGVGIASPLSLGGWHELLGMPPDVASAWNAVDLAAAVGKITEIPVMQVKDTAAACVAELVAGRGRNVGSFLYLFVDTFIGGGLVIDSHLRAGLNGNAGAVGSLPLGCSSTSGAAAPQLLSVASLVTLERAWARAGLPDDVAGDARALQAPWAEVTEAWLQDAASAVAMAISSAACLLDLDGVILDGSFHASLADALLARLPAAMDCYNWEGVVRPALWRGHIGSDARALGGALLPLYANFAPDRALFLKADVPS